MPAKTRKQYKPEFKFKLVQESLKSDNEQIIYPLYCIYLLLWDIWIPQSSLRPQRGPLVFPTTISECRSSRTTLHRMWSIHWRYYRSRKDSHWFLKKSTCCVWPHLKASTSSKSKENKNWIETSWIYGARAWPKWYIISPHENQISFRFSPTDFKPANNFCQHFQLKQQLYI